MKNIRFMTEKMITAYSEDQKIFLGVFRGIRQKRTDIILNIKNRKGTVFTEEN